MYADNDGRFPDDAPVLVRYALADPPPEDREAWEWLPGHVLGQCGPNEWHVVVDGVEELADGQDGDGEPLYPACYRDASEIRLRGEG